VSDRPTLAHAIEDAGIEPTKAERVASAIFDAIRDNVATKADVQSAMAELKADIAAVRANAGLIEHRLLTRLGGLMIVVGGVLFAALHYWPPSGHG
jgi:hypothetical protein